MLTRSLSRPRTDLCKTGLLARALFAHDCRQHGQGPAMIFIEFNEVYTVVADPDDAA